MKLKARLERKAQHQRNIKAGLRTIESLVRRNKDFKPPQRISFPFFIIEPADEPGIITDFRIQLQRDLRKFTVKSNLHMTLYSDLEAIMEVPSLTNGGFPGPIPFAKPWAGGLRYPRPFGESQESNLSPGSLRLDGSPDFPPFRGGSRQRRREE